ncbi:hypothetical protein ACIBJD_33710 [Kitasatospora sp. NPDC050467]|uniref:hypothetical protein n=1 Tax=Kitasatospora sp. NPDC050467 TaxID=3364053 RepID=UPI00379E88EC
MRVPHELAGPPGTDPTERCWRLAWLRADDAWRSVLLTARRRPGPDLPWIAHARWGEDKQAAWVIADGTALRPLPQPAPAADAETETETEAGAPVAPAVPLAPTAPGDPT